MSNRRNLLTTTLVAAVFCLVAEASWAAEESRSEEPDVYVSKATWAETMLASRARYEAWLADPDVALGPWYAVGFPRRTGFPQTILTQKVDLKATGAKGGLLWQERVDWVDGAVHELTVPIANGAVVLYRTVTTARPLRFEAEIGTDSPVEVWLNGSRLLSREPDEAGKPERVVLELKRGENHLVLKFETVWNLRRFYFGQPGDPAGAFGHQMLEDFPVEAGWMERDLGWQGYRRWLRAGDDTELSLAMIRNAARDAGEGLRKKLDKASQVAGAADDSRWLDLYVSACRFRQAASELDRVNVAALRRAINDLSESFPGQYTEAAVYLQSLEAFEQRLPGMRVALADGEPQGVEDVDALVALEREALLANPLFDFDRILLIKRSADLLGLPRNWQGNCSLPRKGYDNEIALLNPLRPEDGLTTLFKPETSRMVADVDLDFGGEKMLFSMIGSHNRWQIWEMGADGGDLRQVTPGTYPDVDNYDACYLPNGKIVFDSTRVFQGIPCVGGKDAVANLYLMDADGQNMRQLCFDQDHSWCPTVLNNGRLLYTRWEYSDTAHYFSRLLFHMYPDGTGQSEYYGSNSYWPNSTFYARAIPNHPTKVAGIISGHHGVERMGELIIFDPAKGRFEADGVVQRIPGYGKKVEPVIADRLVDRSWPKFLHPYPLSENYFLVSCKLSPDALWGLYLVDVFDNLLPLHEMPGQVLFEPVPLRKTPRPPLIPDRVDPDRDDATVYLADIYAGEGLKNVPKGEVKRLRLYEFHYGYNAMGGHKNIGVEGPWDVRRILGTVPVEPDGSASFAVPANTPIAVQPLDEEGKALQIMRSWFTAMPGEVLSCTGCHEQQNTAALMRQTLASRRAPSAIKPWHGPARGFGFKREVQPVLDRYCVGCHDGREDTPLDLMAKTENGWNNFTPSYLELHPYVRRPGPESDYHLQVPLEYHAGTSELVQILEKGHHGVQLDAEAWDRLITWIDLNVPDHATWSEHRGIAKDYRARRLEMRGKYACRPEDPELMPPLDMTPVEFVMPVEPLPALDARAQTAATWAFSGQEAQARQKNASAKTQMSLDLGDGLTMDFALVPAGEFVMGSLDGAGDERPLTPVTIDSPFWMGTLEVTNRQFQQFDADHDNGFFNQQHKDHTTPGYSAHAPGLPAIRVSWEQAMAFCEWLSDRSGVSVTLPTEAQWEWACRAGTATPFSFGGLDTDFSSHANFADRSIGLLAVTGVNPRPIKNPSPYEDFIPKDARFDDKAKIMTDAGTYQPNPWGLYDMHGNVWEWTRSALRPYPYSEGDGRNDLAAEDKRVVRGGSWRDRPNRARSAYRLAYRSYQPVFNVGFRVIVQAAMDRMPSAGQSLLKFD